PCDVAQRDSLPGALTGTTSTSQGDRPPSVARTDRQRFGYRTACYGLSFSAGVVVAGHTVTAVAYVTGRYTSATAWMNSIDLRRIPSAARSLSSCEIFIEQNFGPHIEQKCALFAGDAGSVSSWKDRAVSGSSARLNWSSQRNSNRALDSASSHACARGWPLARSAACAAILYAITPAFTSSRSGRPRCSLGVT